MEGMRQRTRRRAQAGGTADVHYSLHNRSVSTKSQTFHRITRSASKAIVVEEEGELAQL